jgi:hypothetical protein
VPTNAYNDNSNNKQIVLKTPIIEPLESTRNKQQQQIQQLQEQKQEEYSHKGENRHIKKLKEQEELEKSDIKQLILLKQNKQTIIDFLLDSKDSIRIEDLKVYGPIYKCYREKGNCQVCNTITNIICISCGNY